jgi:hypothetical protein
VVRPGVVDQITGSPDGTVFAFGAKAGYLFDVAPALQVGPIAGLTYARVHIDAYSEAGDFVLIQTVQSQDLDGLTGRAGVQIRYSTFWNGRVVMPYLNVTAEHDFLGGARILRYMIFLRDKITSGDINPDLVKAWFMFPEVKQNWMGFSLHGNGGSGLGKDFAEALKANLQKLFANFGNETITSGSHIEKVCLVRSGVGRDMISDFTTNLLKGYICRYTETFAVAHIDSSLRRQRIFSRWTADRVAYPASAAPATESH